MKMVDKERGVIARIAGARTPEVDALIAQGELHTFDIGDMLYTEGEDIDHIYDIVLGMLSVSRVGGNGRRQILGFVNARQFLGAASTPRYPNSVMALTSVEAIAYPKQALRRALQASPEFSENFQEILVKIIESRDDHIFTIGQRTAPERLAFFLLHLRTNQARFSSDGPREKSTRIELPMTRVDIGDYLGLSVETVSRAFSLLKQQRIIDFKNSHECWILDLDKIREYGGRDDLTEHRGGVGIET